jgi:hypothetical protein
MDSIPAATPVAPGTEYSWSVVKLEGDERPIARRYFTVVSHNDKFYLFGGHKPSKEATNDFSVFDPSISDLLTTCHSKLLNSFLYFVFFDFDF